MRRVKLRGSEGSCRAKLLTVTYNHVGTRHVHSHCSCNVGPFTAAGNAAQPCQKRLDDDAPEVWTAKEGGGTHTHNLPCSTGGTLVRSTTHVRLWKDTRSLDAPKRPTSNKPPGGLHQNSAGCRASERWRRRFAYRLEIRGYSGVVWLFEASLCTSVIVTRNKT